MEEVLLVQNGGGFEVGLLAGEHEPEDAEEAGLGCVLVGVGVGEVGVEGLVEAVVVPGGDAGGEGGLVGVLGEVVEGEEAVAEGGGVVPSGWTGVIGLFGGAGDACGGRAGVFGAGDDTPAFFGAEDVVRAELGVRGELGGGGVSFVDLPCTLLDLVVVDEFFPVGSICPFWWLFQILVAVRRRGVGAFAP